MENNIEDWIPFEMVAGNGLEIDILTLSDWEKLVETEIKIDDEYTYVEANAELGCIYWVCTQSGLRSKFAYKINGSSLDKIVEQCNNNNPRRDYFKYFLGGN